MTGRGLLEQRLRDRRDEGRKLLVPYITGGLGRDWTAVVEAVAGAGADAIEIGIPFSDPVMDGPVIQEASQRALYLGATPASILAEARTLDVGVPLVTMTYYNLVFRAGHERFARSLVDAGICGAIVPDLPLEESSGWESSAAEAGLDAVLLAAPITPDERLARICARSRGFVYGVSRMGTTGERDTLSVSAAVMAKRLKSLTDLPVLIGFGVSTAEQAAEVAEEADGVIVGSALMRCVIEGGGPDDVARLVSEMRTALGG